MQDCSNILKICTHSSLTFQPILFGQSLQLEESSAQLAFSLLDDKGQMAVSSPQIVHPIVTLGDWSSFQRIFSTKIWPYPQLTYSTVAE
jgi:hypothetical protein